MIREVAINVDVAKVPGKLFTVATDEIFCATIANRCKCSINAPCSASTPQLNEQHSQTLEQELRCLSKHT